MELEEVDECVFKHGQILWIGPDGWDGDDGEGLTIVGAESKPVTGWCYDLMRSDGTIMVLSQTMLLEFYRIGKLQILV